MTTDLPDRARVVIIGGGVGGASIAYHLTALGWTDVVLLDRDALTSGSTFHSAGLVGQLRGSVTLTRMMMHSIEVYRRLAAETDGTIDPHFAEVGSLRLASSPERLEELRRQAGWAATFGLPLELIGTDEAHDRFPLIDPTGVLGALHLPTDGWLDPSNLCRALARVARNRGAQIHTHTRVVGIDTVPVPTAAGHAGRSVSAVRTDRGTIECDVVVNAGGMFAWELGRMVDVEVPVVPYGHQYVLLRLPDVDADRDLPTDLPTMRDPDRLVYFRRDAAGLIMGGYERNPAPWSVRGVPADFNNRLLEFDWDRFLPLSELAASIIPAVADAQVVHAVNGPEAFTPDGEFILGESDVRGFFVAAGFCAHGIAGAGGIGRVLAEWIVGGEPTMDLWKMDIRRFGTHDRSRTHALARSREVYGHYYDIHYPGEERRAGRPLRTSATWDRLAALGAVFGEKAGWERPNWFASNEDPALEHLRPAGGAGRHWSTAIPAEHRAVRERVGLFDESSFAKLAVAGPDAEGWLQYLCANDVGGPVGSVTYTQLLNERGGIESDLTVTRLGEDAFRLVTGTAFGLHDLAWLRRHRGVEDRVTIEDITSQLGCLALWGPAARAVLGPLTDADLSTAAFPYLTAQPITVGPVPCWAVRVTYVGELGWELYPPAEYTGRLWDELWAAGAEHGMVAGGYRAIDSMRLEKGYLAWATDVSSETGPDAAGLRFALKTDKSVPFVGRDAVLRARRDGPTDRLVNLVIDDVTLVCLGNEPVRHDGGTVGRVTSGGPGYSLGVSIALAWVPVELARTGTPLEVELFGEQVPAVVAPRPLLDPRGERIRT